MLKILNKENKNLVLKSEEKETFFDETSGKTKRIIKLEQGSSLQIFGYFEAQIDYDLEIFVEGNEADLSLNFFVIGNESEQMKFKIKTNIFGNSTKANINIVSFVKNGGLVDIDGIIDVGINLKKVVGNLNQNNIFLGSKGQIRGIPTLLIGSDDVKVGHSLTAEKISDEQLFYLRSRGIDENDSIKFVLNSYFKKTFEGLEKTNKDFYISLFERFSKNF
ncbi:MAG: SufD family Fe-S cluster assembly protein [Candidatus Gracilibacteria bacterium]|nr:SufD family Fe-S cluster assembly protein [Candidatus Gracilibacteria bacterium]MDD3120085.1 SufD family Fe-S cluster assembly protein [Candidatus Gracilibacteria bacterium]MDD4530207.1 SufD family Fe-S cluster assembly protein [Candidatus Gracilibacteria bacterium]